MLTGPVTSRAAVQWAEGERWRVEDVTVDPPGRGEVRVRMEAAGLCHSDLALVEGGYTGWTRPMVGGHEGVGIVESVGLGVTDHAVGDRVLLAIPAPYCGRCDTCLRGLPHLCSRTSVATGRQFSDGTARHHVGATDLAIFVLLGAFAEYTVVHELSCVTVPAGLDPRAIVPVSCAGVTGWGAVQNTAALRQGETVCVVGVGAVGANAVAAARHGGAGLVVAVDPLEARRALALRAGAEVVAPDLDTARSLVAEETGGRMADAVVLCIGTGVGSMLADVMALVATRGRAVVVSVHGDDDLDVRLSLRDLQRTEKQILGCMAGSWHGRHGAAVLLDLAVRGRYDPSLVAGAAYDLADIEQGYADQLAGRTPRAVLTFGACAR